MTKKSYAGPERRKFVRLEYTAPLDYKICKKTTISKILKGYTSNVSEKGLLCNINHKVKKDDILWLSFDKGTLNVVETMEKDSLIYQSGIIGKVVRIEHKKDDTYDVGISFLTRQEKNLTHIYPKIHFMKDKFIILKEGDEDTQEEETNQETPAEAPESESEDAENPDDTDTGNV